MDHLCLPSKHHPQPKHQLSHQHHVIIFIVVTGRILPTINRPLDEFCLFICQNLKIVLKSDLLLFHFDLILTFSVKHFVSAGQPGHSQRKAPELCSVWQNCSRDGNQRWKDTEKVLKLGACGLAGRATRVGSFMSGYHWNDQQMNIGDGGQSSMEDQIPFIDITNHSPLRRKSYRKTLFVLIPVVGFLIFIVTLFILTTYIYACYIIQEQGQCSLIVIFEILKPKDDKL